MKDIFNLLRHNDHNMMIVEIDNEKRLGCIDCGETIFEQSELYSLIEITDIIESDSFKNDFNNLKDMIVKFVNEVIFSKNMEQAMKVTSNDIKNTVQSSRDYNGDIVRLNVYNMLKRNLTIILDVDCIGDVIDRFEIDLSIYVDMIINDIKKFYSGTFEMITKKDEKIVVSNKEYKLHRGENLLMISKDFIKMSEEETPTVNDVVKVHSLNEYLKLAPKWYDEDDDNEKFNEFMYRIKNNLIDIDFENGKFEILRSTLHYFGENEGVDRYYEPALKFLDEILEESKKNKITERVKEFLNKVVEDLSNENNNTKDEETKLLIKDLKSLL